MYSEQFALEGEGNLISKNLLTSPDAHQLENYGVIVIWDHSLELKILGNTFKDNISLMGGAIELRGIRDNDRFGKIFQNNLFNGNLAYLHGGALSITMYISSLSEQQCLGFIFDSQTFTHNTAYFGNGGALHLSCLLQPSYPYGSNRGKVYIDYFFIVNESLAQQQWIEHYDESTGETTYVSVQQD